MLRRRNITGSVLALSATVLWCLAAPSASAAGHDEASPELIHAREAGEQLRFVDQPSTPATTSTTTRHTSVRAAAAIVITCNITADNPHNSTGAKGHIFKSRVSCTGTAGSPASITIRVRGALMYDQANYSGDTSGGISWSAARSSTETRIVRTDGTVNTFYTPQTGTTGATARGHYQGSSTVEILTPVGQKVGSDISSVVFRN